MNHERMSNRKLHQLIRLRVPWMFLNGVDESNRCTVISFLKFLDGGMKTTYKKFRRSIKAA